MELSKMFASDILAAYWNVKKNERAPYYGESKFPTDKKIGLDLSYIKGAQKAPVILSLSAFDAKALPLNRGEVTKLSTEMPFFKNSKIIDEKTRQELNILIGNSNGNNAALKIVLNNIYNDKVALIEDALLTLEVMRMQALTTGVVSIAANGQAYSYDYAIPNSHKVTPTVKWDQAGADPVGDIEEWLDTIEAEKGVRPTEAVLNNHTIGLLRNCTAVKNAIFVNGNGTITPTKKQILKYLEDETDVKFYVNSKVYTNAAGTETKFVPNGVVVFMPARPLGKTWFGTTPEESDLLANPAAKVSIVEKGIAITTSVSIDPVQVETKVSMIALPSFEEADLVIIASVKTA